MTARVKSAASRSSSHAATVHDAALGALLGACVGDAAGATLEFLHREPSADEVKRAMAMSGGGIWRVAPGQVTDDGELTLCLAEGLAAAETFDLEQIARRYADWVHSVPFDMGATTRKSLGCVRDVAWKKMLDTEGYAATMTRAAGETCQGSKANGSLMRSSPLGIWGHRLSDAELADDAARDCRLSHPNESCTSAVACYSLAIAHLVANPGDRAGAFARAEAWAEGNAPIEVRVWLEEAREGVRVKFRPLAGFVRIGFTHAFLHLVRGSGYVTAMRETLAGGGDTDTNACIVGGLVGAACGASGIPEAMSAPVLQCDTRTGQPRPDFLSTRQIPDLVTALLERRGGVNPNEEECSERT